MAGGQELQAVAPAKENWPCRVHGVDLLRVHQEQGVVAFFYLNDEGVITKF